MAAPLYASALVRAFTGVNRAQTVPAPAGAHCAACGCEITAGGVFCGDGRRVLINGASFTDGFFLRDQSSKWLCPDCPATFVAPFLGISALFTARGAFKIGTNIEIASFLLDPPSGPFVAALSNAKNQHVVWKAPVSLSRAMYMVQLGNMTLTIRHDALMNAVKCGRELIDAYKQVVKKSATYRSPISLPDRLLKGQGVIGIHDPIVKAMSGSDELKRYKDVFDRLSLGEKWAANIIGNSGIAEPRQLPLLNMQTQSVLNKGEQA